MRLIALQSSQVAGMAYNADTQELLVQFTNGTWYRYTGVDADSVLAVLFDPDSQGKAFNAHIKAHFPYQKLTEDEVAGLHV